MKTFLIMIVCLISVAANAEIYDTLRFKVNVPKISKADDRAVGVQITYDTIKKTTPQKIIVKNEHGEGLAGASLSVVLDKDTINTLNLITGDKGEIVIDKLSENKTYTVRVTSIGYKLKDTTFNFQNSHEKEIVLKKQYLNFEPVVVNSVIKINICSNIICRLPKSTIESCVDGIVTREKEENFKIYPNPASQGSQIAIELPLQSGNTIIQFYNLSGQLVSQQQINSESGIRKIQLPAIAAGSYQVLILNQELKKKFAGKLVVL